MEQGVAMKGCGRGWWSWRERSRVAEPSSRFCSPFQKRNLGCGCPVLAFCARACPERSRRGGNDAADTITGIMSRLQRFYGAGHLHFITCSCYRRMPLLRSARRRDRFLTIVEQARKRYRFVVVGYVVMAGGRPFRAFDLHSTLRMSGAPSLRSLQGPALSGAEGAGVILPIR